MAGPVVDSPSRSGGSKLLGRWASSATRAPDRLRRVRARASRPLVLVHGLLMNRHMFEPARAGAGQARQPGDLRRPARPRPLRPARGPAPLLDAALRPPAASRCSTTWSSRPRSSAAPRSAPTSRSSWRSASPTGSRACSSRCRCSTTRWRRSPRSSPRSCSGCGWPAGLRGHVAPRLAVPRTNFLLDIGLDWVRRRPGPVAVLEGLLLGETAPAPRGAPADRPAGPDRRPPARPAAPVQRLGDAGRGAAPGAAGRGQLDPRVADHARGA